DPARVGRAPEVSLQCVGHRREFWSHIKGLLPWRSKERDWWDYAVHATARSNYHHRAGVFMARQCAPRDVGIQNCFRKRDSTAPFPQRSILCTGRTREARAGKWKPGATAKRRPIQGISG